MNFEQLKENAFVRVFRRLATRQLHRAAFGLAQVASGGIVTVRGAGISRCAAVIRAESMRRKRRRPLGRWPV